MRKMSRSSALSPSIIVTSASLPLHILNGKRWLEGNDLRHADGLPDHLTGVAPFVVIPAHHLHQIAVNDLRHLAVDDRGPGILNDIRRNHGILRHANHSGIAVAPRFFQK